MSFSIVLMTTEDPDNVITKTATTVSTLTGVLREGTSIVKPTIRIEYSGVPAANYCYISEFGRYYYIRDIISVRTDLWDIVCVVDPLMSWDSDIRSCTGIVHRAQDSAAYNLYLDDGSFRAYANPNIITLEFPTGFTATEFVLAVAGG